MSEIDGRIGDVLLSVFGEKCRGVFTIETTMNDVAEWDSLMFIELIVALEERFNIEISMDEAPAMTDIRTIQKTVLSKLAKRAKSSI